MEEQVLKGSLLGKQINPMVKLFKTKEAEDGLQGHTDGNGFLILD
ncbi:MULTISPECIES: hypothetical protein [Bacillus]|nr:hypothetical protein [Bacillus cereus]EEL12940.1 hypothetical protein bcere0015_8070 [Bacillus cereus BDRD-Cer4]KZD74511.1 hypothetical protein B4155_5000 [Bacillus cereus]WPD82249.1 hypothetical protein R8N76_08690 [Bacillus cereus ATCC 14579]